MKNSPAADKSIAHRRVYFTLLPPAMGVRLGATFELVLSATVLLFMVVYFIVGAFLYLFIKDLHEQVGPQVNLSSLPAEIEYLSPEVYGLIFAFLALFSIVIHELGHGLGYLLTGRKLVCMELGFGGRAWASSDPANSYQKLLTISLGGGMQFLLGAMILWLSGGPGWGLFQLLALYSMAEGGSNLFIPLSRTSDAVSFWRSLLRIVLGDGAKPLTVS